MVQLLPIFLNFRNDTINILNLSKHLIILHSSLDSFRQRIHLKPLNKLIPQNRVDLFNPLNQNLNLYRFSLLKLSIQDIADAKVWNKTHQDNIGVVVQRQKILLVFFVIKNCFDRFLSLYLFLRRFHFKPKFLNNANDSVFSRVESHCRVRPSFL